MSYFTDNIKITLTAVEMATIREALRYAANQVHDSDIPVFETFESLDRHTGELIFDEGMHQCNQAKADLAFELADTLDLIEADSLDWEVLASTSGGHAHISVWCRHHKSSAPMIRKFIWSYVPKHSSLPSTIFTTVLEDCVEPLNTQIAVHYVPYADLTDKSIVKYYKLDDLRNRTPIMTGDEAVDETILEALRNFVSYHG